MFGAVQVLNVLILTLLCVLLFNLVKLTELPPIWERAANSAYHLLFGWLVGCFGFNGPLRQYFSLYQAVSQREGERGEKG